MSLKLPSLRQEFSQFESFFDNEIQPFLARNEKLRKKAIGETLAICAVAAIIFAGALALLNQGSGIRTFILWAAVIGGAGGATARINGARDKITKGLLDRVANFFGYGYEREIGRPEYCEEFSRLGLIGRFNIENWEDAISGSRNGCAFYLCEAHLKYKSSGKKKSTRTVFHGQLITIDYPSEFLGDTVLKRDAGPLNRFSKPSRKFSKVGLASSHFEKVFEAWSTDQVEARTLLDPVMLERFQELDRLFDGAKLRAAYTGQKLIIALNVGDALNMGTMFKPLNRTDRVEKILKEFDLIFDLIDVATKRVDHRIDGAFTVDAIKRA